MMMLLLLLLKIELALKSQSHLAVFVLLSQWFVVNLKGRNYTFLTWRIVLIRQREREREGQIERERDRQTVDN